MANNENLIYLALGVIAILIIGFMIGGVKRFRYRKVELFSPAEKHFLKALDKAVSSEFRILGKVRIADVILPVKGLSNKEYNKSFWKISSKHIDYILLDRDTLDTVCVIELNDRSHKRKDRIKRDAFVDKAFKSAKIPLVWFSAKREYDITEIKNTINNAIHEIEVE